MPKAAPRKQNTHPGAIALLAILALLAVAVIIVGNTVFIIKEVVVEGNRYCTAQEVIDAAGIVLGGSIFSVDESKVKSGVNANRYLQFAGMWRIYPSRLVLAVEENSPRATLHWMGMLVILGDDGIVLEQSAQIDTVVNVPVITGMQVNYVRVGQPISFSVAGQFDAVKAVLEELYFQNVIGEVSELNVAALDNLYLVTQDGLQVVLGSADNLADKIQLMRTGLNFLRGWKEVRGAVLDVTTGEAADYRPPKDTERVIPEDAI